MAGVFSSLQQALAYVRAEMIALANSAIMGGER